MRNFILISSIVFFGQLNAQTQLNKKEIISVHDKEFLDHAMERGIAEFELAKLALEKGNSEAVKNYGTEWVKNYTKSNNELQTLAKQRNIPLPELLSSANKKILEDLSSLKGSEFDKAFWNQIVSFRENEIPILENYLEKGNNPVVKNWALNQLKVLKTDLNQVRQIINSIN